ncbi:MAG: lysophospholipid acyltransferase family protein [Verrucomicrobiota bacterium]
MTPLLRMRHSLEWAILRSAEAVIPQLPLSLVRRGARAVGALAWACDARGRRVIRENLRLALGATHDDRARRRIERENYRLFARTFLELFWGRRLKAEDWDRYFVVKFDSPHAEAVATAGRCIFATAHCGNFEWLSLGRALRSGPSMIIAQDFKNPPLTAIFRRLRSHGGQIIIPQEGAMLKLFRHLKKGGSAAALVDLNTPPDQSATIIRRFGMWSSISVLHVALAARTGVPVVPALAIARPDGRWELRFLEPVYVFTDTPLQQAAQQCWDSIEPVLRQHPEQWMWLYKHWRFLPPDADPSSYPSYANQSNRFKRLFVSEDASHH